MTVLPDTSLWVDYLRSGRDGAAADLDGLLDAGDIVMCGPVLAEILAGARADDRASLWSMFASLPWADLDRDMWRRVGETAAALRSTGATVPLTDVEIAVAAVAADAELWTHDSDFERIAAVLPDVRFYRRLGTR